jgi:DNA ligase-1
MFIMYQKLAFLILSYFVSNQSYSFCYQKPEIQQGVIYQIEKNTDRDISQYYISEKLDGMRGYWNGQQLLSRQGNIINSPVWFTRGWPDVSIDGELWISRDNFQPLMSCVRKIIAGECWKRVKFMMFDLPKNDNRFRIRVKKMQNIARQTQSPYLKAIEQFNVANLAQLNNKLEQVIVNNGEGLMLHLASAYYNVGRTAHLLKLKKNQDAEATVIEHIKGKGKYQQLLGSLKVKTDEGIIFKIGSGFTDLERANPPAIGTIITYKYNGLTKAGKPRFARYWRIRTNKIAKKMTL